MNESIKVEYFVSVMRNYICAVSDKSFRIFIRNLEEVFMREKTSQDFAKKACEIIKKVSLEAISQDVKGYLMGCHPMDIAEIQYNVERSSGLIVKFNRPLPWNLEKQATIKMLSSGKINFDGCSSKIEAHELYYWLQKFFHDHKDEIMHNREDDGDTSSGSGESIYDGDIDSNDDEELPKTLEIGPGISYHAAEISS